MDNATAFVAAESLALYNKIVAHLTAGGKVRIVTYTRATEFSPKHVAMFKPSTSEVGVPGVYVQRGRSWDKALATTIHFSVLRAK